MLPETRRGAPVKEVEPAQICPVAGTVKPKTIMVSGAIRMGSPDGRPTKCVSRNGRRIGQKLKRSLRASVKRLLGRGSLRLLTHRRSRPRARHHPCGGDPRPRLGRIHPFHAGVSAEEPHLCPDLDEVHAVGRSTIWLSIATLSLEAPPKAPPARYT